MNIHLRKLYLLIQHLMILQLRHTTFITQSLKEIHSGRETGLIDTGPFHQKGPQLSYQLFGVYLHLISTVNSDLSETRFI